MHRRGHHIASKRQSTSSEVQRVQRRRASQPVGPVGSVLMLFGVVNLVGLAITDPHAYRRFVVVLTLLAALLGLGCVLGVVWRIEWPQLPELLIPVVMI